MMPPPEVQKVAKFGLFLYQGGKGGKGLREETILFAQHLATGEAITPEQATKTHAWFARFSVNGPAVRARARDNWSPAAVAWALHGGDPMWTWLQRVYREFENLPRRRV